MKDVPTIEEFQQLILKWYEENGRILPWRTTSSPYHILISEIILQQTQVSRVIQKYNDFIKKFPDFYTCILIYKRPSIYLARIGILEKGKIFTRTRKTGHY